MNICVNILRISEKKCSGMNLSPIHRVNWSLPLGKHEEKLMKENQPHLIWECYDFSNAAIVLG